MLEPAGKSILHVIPSLKVSGVCSFATEIARAIPNAFHELYYETSLTDIDPDVVWSAAAAGLTATRVEAITPDIINDKKYIAAILYNVTGHKYIGKIIPTIYYSYGVYDDTPGEDIVVYCSEFARTTSRTGKTITPKSNIIIPPAINYSALKYKQSYAHANFTVAILASDYNKYPGNFIINFLHKLPKDIETYITCLNKYPHPGVASALAASAKIAPLKLCAIKPTGTAEYLKYSDILVYVTADDYYEPYGLIAMEAAAMGKPLICKRQGALPAIFKDSALFFDTEDEAIEHILNLQKNKELYTHLQKLGRQTASWNDINLHIGGLKKLISKL